jgi:hypothetical protein
MEAPMKYLALIYSDENNSAINPPPDSPEMGLLIDGYMAFGAAGGEAGVILGGDALMPTTTATSVQVRNGDTIATDGPFAETKEHLGGYYLLECENLDQAIEWAARIPHAATGTIEVRPVINFETDD